MHTTRSNDTQLTVSVLHPYVLVRIEHSTSRPSFLHLHFLSIFGFLSFESRLKLSHSFLIVWMCHTLLAYRRLHTQFISFILGLVGSVLRIESEKFWVRQLCWISDKFHSTPFDNWCLIVPIILTKQNCLIAVHSHSEPRSLR